MARAPYEALSPLEHSATHNGTTTRMAQLSV